MGDVGSSFAGNEFTVSAICSRNETLNSSAFLPLFSLGGRPMGTLRRLGFYGVMLFLAAFLLTAGCDTGGKSRPAAPARPAPPPPPPPTAATQPSPPPVSEWKPDPKLLDELEPYRDVGDYQIRVPKFCEPQPASNLGGKFSSFTKIKRWAGRLRNDGTRFVLSLLTATDLPADATSNEVAEEEIDSIISELEDLHQNTEWHEMAPESGQIGGMSFVKDRVEGTMGGKKGHWIRYITKNGPTTIVISVFDFEGDDKRQFDIGLASALTFRKK
jgi:hypothetical protein